MIQLSHLVHQFGTHPVLRDISLHVQAGERVALLGQNGAGKTTLLRVLSTFLPPHAGYGSVAGYDLFEAADHIRQSIGYLPECVPLYPDLTVSEYLKFRGRLRQMPRLHLRRRLHDVLTLCDLNAVRFKLIRTLSNGQRHRVGLADVILHEPSVLLLDDPLAACDPEQTEKIMDLIASPAFTEQRAVLFSTHDRTFVERVATRVLFLDQGRIAQDISGPNVLQGKSLRACFDAWRMQPTAEPTAVSPADAAQSRDSVAESRLQGGAA